MLATTTSFVARCSPVCRFMRGLDMSTLMLPAATMTSCVPRCSVLATTTSSVARCSLVCRFMRGLDVSTLMLPAATNHDHLCTLVFHVGYHDLFCT